MARHAQRMTTGHFVCKPCTEHECEKCMDRLRARVLTNVPRLCKCTKEGCHDASVNV